MHSLLTEYKIGMYTLKVGTIKEFIYGVNIEFQAIEFELKRAESREAERSEKRTKIEEELAAVNELNIATEEKRDQREKLKYKLETDALKHKKQILKQDKVLFVAFYILLNLAEDVNVERKMIKKDIIFYLIRKIFPS